MTPPCDDAAHAGDLRELLTVHDVARRSSHDGEHLACFDRPRGGRGDMCVHIADRDGDPLRQTGPLRGLRGQAAGPRAERVERAADLLRDEVREALVEGAQVVLGGVAAVLEDALVARRARVARLAPAQLPDDPVGALDEAVHPLVDLGVLLEDLQALGELPLRRDQAAVAREPGLAALARHGVDALGLPARRVVLPELGIGVRALAQVVQPAQRGAVGEHGQRRRRGEVGGDPDDLVGLDAGRGHRRRHRLAQDVDVVLGVLQRPLGRQALA